MRATRPDSSIGPRAAVIAAAVLALGACGSGPATQYRFTEAVTACESRDWAEGRAALLSEGDTVEAGRYASSRCFRVEPARTVTIVDRQGGFFRGDRRIVQVETTDGEPLEHYAGAQFRATIGETAPTEGWVSMADLVEVGGGS